MKRLAVLLLLVVATGDLSRAQDHTSHDEFARTVYAGLEQRIRNEYGASLQALQQHFGEAPLRLEKMQHGIKVQLHNKAALLAVCAADAEDVRSPRAARVRAENNLVLTTCFEKKLAEMADFTNKSGYASVFFPERIKRCGDASRLPEYERLLPPYEFLQLTQARLYDFAGYSKCLMTGD